MNLLPWNKAGGRITADNLGFWLHYRLSVITHLQFSLILSAIQYFGDPIDCALDLVDKNLANIIDNYCWQSGTWTFKSLDGVAPPTLAKHPPGLAQFNSMYHRKIDHR